MNIREITLIFVLAFSFALTASAQVETEPAPAGEQVEDRVEAVETEQVDPAAPADAEPEQEPEKEAEKPVPKSYEFTIQHNHDTTPVKNQGVTGTCWCFASASFLESELLREGKG